MKLGSPPQPLRRTGADNLPTTHSPEELISPAKHALSPQLPRLFLEVHVLFS
jgi:hypothetical protein